MIDTIKLLEESLIESYKSNSVINRLEKRAEIFAEEKVMAKYGNVPLFNDGLEYELLGVVANAYRNDPLDLGKIELRLDYFCVSKLPKHKRERLEKCKEEYLRTKKHPDLIDWNNYNIPIWKSKKYSLNLEYVMNGEINLQIK